MARLSVAEAGSPNVLAFLDMIAWAEGTDNGRQLTKDDGYDVIVGGQLMSGYADHPRKFVRLPKYSITSSAAGRYQILARNWDHYRAQLGLRGGFTPENQDRIAIQLIRERRALGDIMEGRFQDAVRKVRNIWASMPGAGYGQHEQKVAVLEEKYRKAGGRIAVA